MRLNFHCFSAGGFHFLQRLNEVNRHQVKEDTAEQHDVPDMLCSEAGAQTELFWASYLGHVSRIKELVVMRADVNFHDYGFRTALHLAACRNNQVVVEELLTLEADPNKKDLHGNTPLDDAEREHADQCVEVLQAHIIAKENMSSGSKPCPDDESLLFAHLGAAQVDYMQLAPLLAERGLLVDGRDPRISHLSSHVTLHAGSDELQPGHVVHKSLTGALTIPNWSVFQKLVSEMLAEIEDEDDDNLIEQFFSKRLRSRMTEAHTCKVLPEGSNIPENTLGAACWTCDGQFHEFGNTESVPITVSNMIWPILVLFLSNDPNFDVDSLGHEPASRSEDHLCLNADGRPFNPFMWTGELVMCEHLVKLAQQNGFDQLVDSTFPCEAPQQLLELVGFFDFWRGLCGNDHVEIDGPMYDMLFASYRVRQAFFYLLEANMLTAVHLVEITVAAWCALRCIRSTTSSIAFMGTIVANHGVHPFTGHRLLHSDQCQRVMALLFACGGDWAAGNVQVLMGLPVKTARNGLCLMIVPQVLAICCLSPVCHLYQNSLKGMALLKSFSGCFGLHMFERAEWDLTGGTWNLQKYWGSDKHVDGSRVLAAAAHGDITTLQ